MCGYIQGKKLVVPRLEDVVGWWEELEVEDRSHILEEINSRKDTWVGMLEGLDPTREQDTERQLACDNEQVLAFGLPGLPKKGAEVKPPLVIPRIPEHPDFTIHRMSAPLQQEDFGRPGDGTFSVAGKGCKSFYLGRCPGENVE